MDIVQNGSNGKGPLHLITGTVLRRRLRGLTAAQKARLAAFMLEGDATFTGLSQTQMARLVGVPSNMVGIARGHAGIRGVRQSTVDGLVRKYGADRLMSALDRYTAPAEAAE
jgi:hypothetical protein